MSFNKTLLLTVLAFGFDVSPAFAGEIPVPPRKPVFTPASADAQDKIIHSPDSAATNISPAMEHQPELEPGALVVSRKEDLMLSCAELRTEVSEMSKIITHTQDLKDKGRMQSTGISAAGAVGSFLVGTVTGGIGLAVGGLVLDQSVKGHVNDADELQDIAEQRRTWVKGLYTAQACEGPIEPPQQEAMIEELRSHDRTPLEKLAKITPAAGDKEALSVPEQEFSRQTELQKPYND